MRAQLLDSGGKEDVALELLRSRHPRVVLPTTAVTVVASGQTAATTTTAGFASHLRPLVPKTRTFPTHNVQIRSDPTVTFSKNLGNECTKAGVAGGVAGAYEYAQSTKRGSHYNPHNLTIDLISGAVEAQTMSRSPMDGRNAELRSGWCVYPKAKQKQFAFTL